MGDSAPFQLKPREEAYFTAVVYLRPELDLGWRCFARFSRDFDNVSLTLFDLQKTGRWHDELLVDFYRESFNPNLNFWGVPIDDVLEVVQSLERAKHYASWVVYKELFFDNVDLAVQTITFKEMTYKGKRPLNDRTSAKYDGTFEAVGRFTEFTARPPTPGCSTQYYQRSYARFAFSAFTDQLTLPFPDLRSSLNYFV